jgi:hypothetical protein
VGGIDHHRIISLGGKRDVYGSASTPTCPFLPCQGRPTNRSPTSRSIPAATSGSMKLASGSHHIDRSIAVQWPMAAVAPRRPARSLGPFYSARVARRQPRRTSRAPPPGSVWHSLPGQAGVVLARETDGWRGRERGGLTLLACRYLLRGGQRMKSPSWRPCWLDLDHWHRVDSTYSALLSLNTVGRQISSTHVPLF